MTKRGFLYSAGLGVAALLSAGCSKSPPPLYPITGKVTLGGKGYERLIVYFRPVEGPVNEFNIGVGETDKDGTLHLRSAGGDGVMAGEYRVTFTLQLIKSGSGTRALELDEKAGESAGGGKVTTVQLIPDEYVAGKAEQSTPVRFAVKPGERNHFEFDIPSKK